jgi:hypothetical protein
MDVLKCPRVGQTSCKNRDSTPAGTPSGSGGRKTDNFWEIWNLSDGLRILEVEAVNSYKVVLSPTTRLRQVKYAIPLATCVFVLVCLESEFLFGQPSANTTPAEVSERLLKAFDYAKNLSEQLITLSTALIGLTVTFTKDLFGGGGPRDRRVLLLGWVLLTVSIGLGIMALMALTGELVPALPGPLPAVENIGFWPRTWAAGQLLFFTSGIVTLVVYAWRLQQPQKEQMVPE